MLLALAFALTTTSDFDFYSFGPYDARVTKPEHILGYDPGERHTTYFEQEKVIQAIALTASDRVQITSYGKSTEGRPLRILTISDTENIKKLDEITAYNQKIANGEIKPEDIDPNAPVIVWINECIHGNETASFESAMWLCYTLAASQNSSITDALKKSVVIVNPCYNPDGHERFVVWYNSIVRGDKSDDAVEHNEGFMNNGRTNHYRFDLNRDRVAMSQVETQQEVMEFRKWNPHVYVDQHGQVGTYFFPPVAQSIHKDIGRERYIELSTILGKATAKAFDEQGWRYYTRETFDFYGAVYLDTWSSLNGAIGLTHETDGGRAIRQEREDGSVVTLKDGMAKHFTSALSVLQSTSQSKGEFLKSFAQYKQEAFTAKNAGKVRGVIITGDERALKRLAEVLDKQDIKYIFNNEPFSQDATSFFELAEKKQNFIGFTLTVDIAQPRGHLASAILAPGQDFEKDFTERQLKIREGLKSNEKYPGRDGIEFYDTTGWSVPLAFGLESYWTKRAPYGNNSSVSYPRHSDGGKVGWQIPYTDQEDALAIIEMLGEDVRVHVATKPMLIDDEIKAGTFFVFRDRNDSEIDKKVIDILVKHDCNSLRLQTSFATEGVSGPGSDSVVSLTKPEIAVVFGDQPNGTQFGSAWFAFEKTFNLPFTAISQRTLERDLDKYTCIILPRGGKPTDNLKKWVEGGGVLIALGNDSVIGKDNYIDLKKSKLKDDKDPTELPGALFKATLNPRSPLAYGYDVSKPIAVSLSGSTFYKKREEGGGVVLFGAKPEVLSGWSWPDEDEALSDIVWMHDQPLGQGHVIWFAEDPTDRAMWQGTYKLLLNAVLMGKKQ